jgi:hypothetical protein
MEQSWLKKTLLRTSELVFAVLLALVFFLVLLKTLNMLFPMGSSLVMAVGDVGIGREVIGSDDRRFRMSQGRLDYNLAEPDLWAARLEKIEHSVRSKRSSGIIWRRATQGMDLFDRDAVQTLTNSSATIRFDEGNYIRMGNNSLIVIKKYEEDLLFREKRSFMVMVDGELEGTINSSGEKSVFLEVITPAAVTTIKTSESVGETASFRISVEDDMSSVVTVYSGSAQVESQGEKVVVLANQASMIRLDAAPTRPVELPGPPSLTSPIDDGDYLYQSLPPRIWFRWDEKKEATCYHLLIARDPGFDEVILNEKELTTNYFAHGNLKNGDYYWRVSALASAGEGSYSRTRKVTLVKDRTAPELLVEMPPDTVYSDTFLLAGKAEPAALIFVSNDKIQTSPTGEFAYELKLDRGMNMVVVEAMDPAGNVSFKSKFVNYKK